MTPDAELKLVLATQHETDTVRATITEGISELTHARLEIATNEHLVMDGVLETDAQIILAPEGFPSRLWTLRVGHLDFIKITEGSLRYVVNLYPALWLLRFTTNTRKFRNMSAEQIITQILDAHNVEHRFSLFRKTEVRKYCAQYRETNLDFVLRLLEWEGIYYYFDPDGTLVMEDRSPDVSPVNEISAFDLQDAEGAMQWGSVGIFSFRKRRSVASGKATVNDFNWKKPKVSLLSSAAEEDDAELEIYDYPVGYRREDQGAVIAQRRLEAQRVPSRRVMGAGNVTSFEPARSFVFGSLASARFAGEYCLTDVKHHYVNRKYTEHEEGTENEVNYRNHFEAIPKATPFRPPLVTPYPHIAGCHTAMVRGPEGEEIHTDQHGRYRAQFHWDREAKGTDEDSRWLRNTQEVATGMVLARVGWEQSIAYVNGDPDRPFGFARNINGQMTPEYPSPAQNTRTTIKTPTYPSSSGDFNELRIEDLAGAQHMDWRASNDFIGQTERDKSEHIGGNETKKVNQSFAWSVGNNQQIEIGSDLEIQVGKNCSFNVDGDHNKKVTGKEEIEVTKVYNYKIEGNDTEEVTGERNVKCAKEGGSITRGINKKLTRTVETDWTLDGKGNCELIVQADFDEIVGADKTVKVEEAGMGVNVGGIWNMTVKGQSVRTSEKTMGYGSKDTELTVKGDATLHGKKRIAINSDVILLEAEKCIELKSKDLSIKLERNKTTIQGKMRIDAGGDIKVNGNINNLTK